MTPIKRPQLLHYMNIGTAVEPQFTLMNEGFTAMDNSLEAQTEEIHYIAEQNARTLTNGLTSSWSFTAGLETGDPVSKFVYDICADQILDKEVDIVTVESWGSDKTALTARKILATIAPSKEPSGEPGSMLTFEGNINQIGSIIKGTFNMTTKEFTANGE